VPAGAREIAGINYPFRNLPILQKGWQTCSTDMSSPPQYAIPRAPRTCLAETTPTVLRCPNGSRVLGNLQIVSVTGGLLKLSKPLHRGTRVKVMFFTRKGSVFGAAEMLSPVSRIHQPFKFVRLYDDDEERLQAAIQAAMQSRRKHGQTERSRA
jgi:hypothetical protein